MAKQRQAIVGKCYGRVYMTEEKGLVVCMESPQLRSKVRVNNITFVTETVIQTSMLELQPDQG